VKELFSEILHHKSILLFIAGTALFMEPIHTVVTFYNQLQYERAGIPMKWFGILYRLMTVLSLSSAMLDRMIEHTGRKKLFTILFVIGISIPLLLITTDNVIPSIILLALLALSESLFAPLYDLTANDAVSYILTCIHAFNILPYSQTSSTPSTDFYRWGLRRMCHYQPHTH